MDWDPPSRWDDGIPGLIADYSINAQTRHDEQSGDDSNDISGNGTVGGRTSARGVCAPTGRRTTSIPAAVMTMKTVTVTAHKETGSGAATTPGAPCRH